MSSQAKQQFQELAVKAEERRKEAANEKH